MVVIQSLEGSCGCDCTAMPYTVTVTPSFSGAVPYRSFHGELVADSCFGTGATAVVTGPGGSEGDRGPVTGVELRNPGCGYAIVGRVQPVIVLSANGDSAIGDVELTPSYEMLQDECGVDYWRISSVSISGSGFGYDEVIATPSSVDDVVESAQEFTLNTTNAEPTLEPYVSGLPPEEEPSLEIFYSESTGYSGLRYTIAQINIISGGSGYGGRSTVSVFFRLGANDQKIGFGGTEYAIATIENDSIVSFSYLPTAAYAKTGVPASVSVSQGGVYYRNDLTATPYTASVTFTHSSNENFYATHPTVVGVVDSDVASASFGRIVSVEVQDAGSNFLAWTDDYDNPRAVLFSGTAGRQIVMKSSHPRILTWLCVRASYGDDPPVPPRLNPETTFFFWHKHWDGRETGLKQEWIAGVEPPFVIEPPYLAGLARLGRKQPTSLYVDNYLSGGSGAEAQYQFLQIQGLDGSPAWRITGGSVTSGGSGYTDKAIVRVRASLPSSSIAYAELMLNTRVEPNIEITPETGNATFSVSLASLIDGEGRTAWEVESVSVTNGGSGYQEPPTISAAGEGLVVVGGAEPSFQAVLEDGSVVDVIVLDGGVFYEESGAAQSFEVLSGGEFYESDASLPPIVADVEIVVNQLPPSHGSGASFTATINTDVNSIYFGYISSIEAVSEGSGYLLYGVNSGAMPIGLMYLYERGIGVDFSGYEYSIATPQPCTFRVGCGAEADTWHTLYAERGQLRLFVPELGNNAQYVGEAPSQCNQFSVELAPRQPEAPPNASFTVTPGGGWDSHLAYGCRGCRPTVPSDLDQLQSIVVSVAVERDALGGGTTTTNHTLTLTGSNGWSDSVFDEELPALYGITISARLIFTPGRYYAIEVAAASYSATKFIEGAIYDGKCYPQGYETWVWQNRQEGEQYTPLVDGKELPPEGQTLDVYAVSSSATAVFA